MSISVLRDHVEQGVTSQTAYHATRRHRADARGSLLCRTSMACTLRPCYILHQGVSALQDQHGVHIATMLCTAPRET